MNMAATGGFNAGDLVFYKDATEARVVDVLVKKTATKPGMYVVRWWRGTVQMADQCVQERLLAARPRQEQRAA